VVNFCGTTWDIIEDFRIEEDGICSFNNQTIRVNGARHTHRKGLSLTHELLHVIFDQAGIDDDEELVKRIEHGVYELINVFPEGYK